MYINKLLYGKEKKGNKPSMDGYKLYLVVGGSIWFCRSVMSSSHCLDTLQRKGQIVLGTGWPIIHGSVFLVPCKKRLVQRLRVH